MLKQLTDLGYDNSGGSRTPLVKHGSDHSFRRWRAVGLESWLRSTSSSMGSQTGHVAGLRQESLGQPKGMQKHHLNYLVFDLARGWRLETSGI